MNVELQLGKRKQDTRIIVDGVEQRGILDFSVDFTDDIPSITLKVWAESMRVTCPNLVLIDRSIRREAGRAKLKQLFWYSVRELYRNVIRARDELRSIWHQESYRRHGRLP